jgi:outer membrane protein TolC
VARARERALDVVDARAEVGVAAAARKGASVPGIDNPYLETFVNGPVAQGSQVEMQTNLWLPIEVSGQRSARLGAADALQQWRAQGVIDAQGRATALAVTAYGNALVAAARLAEAQEGERDARKELEWFVARAAAGDATAVDRNLAEAEVARWVQAGAEASMDLVGAREQLAALTDRADIAAPPSGSPADPPPVARASFDALLGAGLDRAPALRALTFEGAYWSAERERASTEKFPPVSVIGTVGRDRQGGVVVGGGLAWTFPVLRRNQAQVLHADAQRARAEALRATTRRVLEARARGAMDTYTVGEDALASLAREGIPAAQRVVEATYAAYKAGKLELARVLAARRDLAASQARRLSLMAVVWQAYGELTAIGGGLP